jgi:hypothetical protein
MPRTVPLVALLAFLSACGRPTALPPDLFPTETPGGWHRVELRDLPISEAPDPIPRTSVAKIAAARYEGPGKIEARVYVLTSTEVGLDLAQRWRPSADTVFFNLGHYFVVVKWQEVNRQALQEFVRGLEKRLAPPS